MQHKLTNSRLVLKAGVIPHKNIEKPFRGIDITQISPVRKKRQGGSPLQDVTPVKKSKKVTMASPTMSTTSPSTSSSTEFQLTSTSTSSQSSEEIAEENVSEQLKELSKKRIKLVIESASRFYLGLPRDVYFILKIIPNMRPISYLHILVTLKKIRLNDPYFRIGMDFGISPSYVGNIFRNSCKILAEVFNQLIIWPLSDTIYKYLPISFRKRYSNVNSIIDCFEIAIEKPSNPEHQALTWSTYKNTNTIKYLISCTPYGLVNYISQGFGGRASDILIVENCGYLNKLPNNVDVMADRGFKYLSAVLKEKNCNLVRPPSVSEGEKLSKQEVMAAKRVASLRIHVERVISRIREFKFLNPHAHIDIHTIGSLDAVVIIVCGIINLQPALIKC